MVIIYGLAISLVIEHAMNSLDVRWIQSLEYVKQAIQE